MLRFNLRLNQDKNFQDRVVNDFGNLKKELAKEFKQKFKDHDHGKIVNKNTAGKTIKIDQSCTILSTEEGK